MSLFPILGDNLAAEAQELPLLRDAACDPETGLPIFRDGAPVIAEGAEAVRLWIVTALRTPRYRHAIYSDQFGSELDALTGQSFSDDIKTAEAPRLLREALLINPYIRDVTDVTVDFSGSTMTVSATVQTIYGEVEIDGYDV